MVFHAGRLANPSYSLSYALFYTSLSLSLSECILSSVGTSRFDRVAADTCRATDSVKTEEVRCWIILVNVGRPRMRCCWVIISKQSLIKFGRCVGSV